MTIVAENSITQGQWLVVVYTDGGNAFVPNMLLMFKPGSRKGDYQMDINYKNYNSG